MMGKNYTKKTNRSRRKLHKLPDDAVRVDIAGGRATFQMVLPMKELMAEVADAIEEGSARNLAVAPDNWQGVANERVVR